MDFLERNQEILRDLVISKFLTFLRSHWNLPHSDLTDEPTRLDWDDQGRDKPGSLGTFWGQWHLCHAKHQLVRFLHFSVKSQEKYDCPPAGRRNPPRWRAPNWATCRETRRRGRLSSASTGLCPRIPSMHKTTTMCENAQDNYDVWTFSLRKESYMWQLKMWKEIYVPIISSSGLSSECFERLCVCACHGFVTDVSTSLDCMIRCSIIGSLLSAD